MSSTAAPSFIIRKIELNDCQEVLNILKLFDFDQSKYINRVMIKVDSDAILVAQDIKTG